MIFRCLVFFVYLNVGNLPLSFGQSPGENEARAKWLSTVTVSLDSIAGDPSHRLLDSIQSVLDGADVVAFGEPTHGDGAAFLFRNHLSRLLHERLGFGTLALEALGRFENSDAIQSRSAAWLWSGSQQARIGLDYALNGAENVDPMRVVGIDVQHQFTEPLWTETEAALERIGVLDSNWVQVRDVLLGAFSNPFAPVEQDVQKQIAVSVQRYSSALSSNNSEASALFLSNALANASTAWHQSYEPRDSQMADNLLTLIEPSESHGKVILWAASSHAVKSLAAIDNRNPEWSYDDSFTLGQSIREQIGDRYFMIAFTACGGEYGASHIGLDEKQITLPQSGSLEALACSLPFEEAALINVRSLSERKEGGWLQSPLIARPLGYEDMLASWPLVVDGLIVIRNMTKSFPLN